MEHQPNQFKQSALVAMDDEQLQTALKRATDNVEISRREKLDELPDVQGARQQGRGAKLRALHDLPELLEQLESRIAQQGGTVLWALDADEALGHVLDICWKHNLKRGVKAKSMVTEEIELVPALEAAGIEMVETDLGEFIVQIAEDRPSHLIMPVMHMTKETIRDVFVEKLDMPPPDDSDGMRMAQEMTAFARELLREKFLNADFGMSGGNFLIAETGTLVTVTNEGNGRLSTGFPPVHIAMVGIEKVVPTWEDFITLLQLLTRNATGQRLSVYTSMITGSAREDDPDGPRHFYLILVDKGRSDIYASEYAEALACLRCGTCLNVCPVYQSVGGHTYGSIYPGPIGSVITPLMKGKHNAALLPFACSLCGECEEGCPVGIRLPDLLLKLRRDLVNEQSPAWKWGMMGYGVSFSNPALYEMGGKVASKATNQLIEGVDSIGELPFPFNAWTDARDFPPFAEQSFRQWWRNRPKE